MAYNKVLPTYHTDEQNYVLEKSAESGLSSPAVNKACQDSSEEMFQQSYWV